MPMTRCQIEPTKLTQFNEPLPCTSLTDTANHTIVNVLHQLGCLARLSDEVFSELIQQVSHVSQRAIKLHSKVEHLRQLSAGLSAASDEVSLEDLGLYKAYKSSNRKVESIADRPASLQATYQSATPPPQLSKMNQFRNDGKDCCKLYTNPNFFFELWLSQIVQEVERKRPVAKKSQIQAPVITVHQPKNTRQMMIHKVGDMGISKPTAPPKTNSATSINTSLDVASVENETLLSGVSDEVNNNSLSGVHQHIESNDSQLDDVTIQSSQLFPAPPPPQPFIPPPPPPLFLQNDTVGQTKDKIRGSIYIVTAFDRNTFYLPPPPPPPDVGLQQGAPDILDPDVPPPPPPPMITMGTGFAVKRTEGSGEAKNMKKRESRSDLLSSIREGINLRKVTDASTGAGATKQISAGGGLAASLLDVQAILEMRRRAFENDDDENDDDDDQGWDD